MIETSSRRALLRMREHGLLIGNTIKSAHITELRLALDAALTALGLTAGGYTNSPLTGAQLKAIDCQELRNRVR